jgi:hypothetical protein
MAIRERQCGEGVGREKYVADPLTCTPPRKIRHRFRGGKHTSLAFSVGGVFSALTPVHVTVASWMRDKVYNPPREGRRRKRPYGER